MAYFRFGDYAVTIRATPHLNLFQGWDVHHLALSFEVAAHDAYIVDAPFLVSGRLWALDLAGPVHWLGVLNAPDGPIGLKQFATLLTLETTLTERQLRGLEKSRAGADLTLRADLTLTGLAEKQRWPAPGDGRAVIHARHTTIHLRMPDLGSPTGRSTSNT